MFEHTGRAIMSILIASSFSTVGAWAEATGKKLPEPATAGFAEKLYRVSAATLCQRQVGVDTGRERWDDHRIFVNLLADKARESIGIWIQVFLNQP